MNKLWGGLTKTDSDMLKFLQKQEASMGAKHKRMKSTIDNRHLADSEELEATVGAELASIRGRIAELEAKKQTEAGA